MFKRWILFIIHWERERERERERESTIHTTQDTEELQQHLQTVYRISTNIHTTQDTGNLQQHLQVVYNWAYKNNMIFKSAKFEVIRYGQNKNQQDVTYTSGDDILVEKSSLKDLGVWLNRDCSFRKHVHSPGVLCQYPLLTT